MKHSVSTKVLQDILNYLANRPYTEVAALIKALQDNSQVIPEESVQAAQPAEVVE